MDCLSTLPQRVLNTQMRGWLFLLFVNHSKDFLWFTDCLMYKWPEFGLFSTVIYIYIYIQCSLTSKLMFHYLHRSLFSATKTNWYINIILTYLPWWVFPNLCDRPSKMFKQILKNVQYREWTARQDKLTMCNHASRFSPNITTFVKQIFIGF